MKINGFCDCSDCTKKRRSFYEVVFWLLLTLMCGVAVASVFWK